MTVILLRVIDLETGGMDPPASVIEIGYTDLLFDTDTKEVEIRPTRSGLYKPAETLAPENIAVHHLTNSMLAGYKLCTAEDLKQVAMLDDPFALVAANAAFERKWFTEEITGARRWICTVKAAAKLYPDAGSHSNQAMRYQLGLELPDELAMPPHRAGPDSYVTAHILKCFLATTSVRDLVQWTKEPKHLPRCPFGKHKGAAWADIPADYLSWVLGQADMDEDVKHAARLETARRTGSLQ